jgi:hypothetical protein
MADFRQTLGTFLLSHSNYITGYIVMVFRCVICDLYAIILYQQLPFNTTKIITAHTMGPSIH